MPVNPDMEQLQAVAAIAGTPEDRPALMVNMNRYRDRAHYEGEVPGGLPADVSGYEAYLRYGAVAMPSLAEVGARIVFHTQALATVIGDDTDVYDEIFGVWYPSAQAFIDLQSVPGYMDAVPHRTAALERAAIVRCAAGPSADEALGFFGPE